MSVLYVAHYLATICVNNILDFPTYVFQLALLLKLLNFPHTVYLLYLSSVSGS